MNFLEKIAVDVAKFSLAALQKTLTIIQPVVSAVDPAAGLAITTVEGWIAYAIQAEAVLQAASAALGGAGTTDSARVAALEPAIVQGLTDLAQTKLGAKIVNQALFDQAVTLYCSATVQFLQSIGD